MQTDHAPLYFVCYLLQALLFVLYPALVLGWVLSGSWYGLWRAHTN
jgi:hypothetical protein